jgi:hypothetical protein
MSRRARPQGQHLARPLLRRLDRATENLNPILIVLSVGLAILYCSVFAALHLAPPH